MSAQDDDRTAMEAAFSNRFAGQYSYHPVREEGFEAGWKAGRTYEYERMQFIHGEDQKHIENLAAIVERVRALVKFPLLIAETEFAMGSNDMQSRVRDALAGMINVPASPFDKRDATNAYLDEPATTDTSGEKP